MMNILGKRSVCVLKGGWLYRMVSYYEQVGPELTFVPDNGSQSIEISRRW